MFERIAAVDTVRWPQQNNPHSHTHPVSVPHQRACARV
jgi:hypothetical protein